jgi:hypothetical protein
MTQTGLSFGILVIVIYLLFVICDLEFFSETKKFLSRSNWPLFRPAAGLNGERRTFEP